MDMLRRIADSRDVSASKPADYHVVGVPLRSRTPPNVTGTISRAPGGRCGNSVGARWRPRPALRLASNWLLPLFDEHGFGRLPALHDGIRSDDETTVFLVTHAWQHLPIHLVGWDQKLDERPPTGGLPPQSMLQECLNRTQATCGGSSPTGGAAHPARLHQPHRGLLPGDRPGGDVRRGAVRRVRPALPAAARLPLRGRGRRRAIDVPDGEVAHRGHRGGRPRPGPAPRRRRGRARSTRHRVP